jgi:hypothetical protein
MRRGLRSRWWSFAIVDESVNIFAPAERLLTNTGHCCIQTFRAITDDFDRLVGAQSIEIGLTTGSGENRGGSLGQLLQRFERAKISPLKSISISRG